MNMAQHEGGLGCLAQDTAAVTASLKSMVWGSGGWPFLKG